MPARPGAPEPAASCIVDDALAFDDVLLVPRRSSVLPEEIDTYDPYDEEVRVWQAWARRNCAK